MSDRAHLYRVLLNPNGTPLTGASIAVLDPTTNLAVSAVLYAAETGLTTLTNPFTAATGVVEFWLAVEQRVHLQYTPSGGSPTTVTVDVNPSANDIGLGGPGSIFDPSSILTSISVLNGEYTSLSGTVTALSTTVSGYSASIASAVSGTATNTSSISSLVTTVNGLPLLATTGTPTTVAGTAVLGTAVTAAHSDHVHAGVLLTATSPQAVAGTAAVGTGTAAARSDHVHVGVLLEGTTAPKAASNTPAVGSGTTSSKQDHVHPTKLWTPSANNLLGASADPQYIPGGSLLSGGVIQMIWIPLAEGGLIANLLYGVQTAGTGLTSAQCWIGVYGSDGTTATLLCTPVDQTTNFGAVNDHTVAVTVRAGQSLTVAAGGGVYLALLSNASTTQVSLWSPGTQSTAANIGLAAGAYRFCQSGSAQSTLPSTITLSGTTRTRSYWGAVS